MELNVYDVIKGPVISDKAYKLNRTLNQLVLEVRLDATKPTIKTALEKLFDVKVKAVRTCRRKYPVSRGAAQRRMGKPKEKVIKVAYVSLKEGYSLSLFEQAGSPVTTTERPKVVESTK